MKKFQVGDIVIFTRACPNSTFHGASGVVISNNRGKLKIQLPHHPRHMKGTSWIEVVTIDNYALIRGLTKLDKALN